MAESRSDQCSDKGAKAKKGKEAMLHNGKQHATHHDKETHGLRNDINENTPIGEFKGPNMFERAKEEIEAIVEAIHPHKDKGRKDHGSPQNDDRGDAVNTASKHEKKIWQADVKKEKVEVKADKHKETKSPRHHGKETRGKGDDIDVNIPISEFKGPSIFDRAKEEIEALVQTIHPKKESDHNFSSPKKDGFRASLGKKIEKMCSPKAKSHNKV